MGKSWIVALLILTGCATVHTQTVPLIQTLNTCQVSEVRPSWLSTLTIGVCWGHDGQVIGMTGTGGKPVIAIPLETMQALATLVGPGIAAYILGSALVKTGQAGIDVRHSGTVHGTVTGTIDASSVVLPPLPSQVP